MFSIPFKLSVIFEELSHFFYPPPSAIYYCNVVAGHYRHLLNHKWDKYYRSTVPVSIKDRLIYGYCFLMTVRYLAAGVSLYNGWERTYFRYDIVMYAIQKKGRFDKITFVLCSLLLVYCFLEHYIRWYWTDLAVAGEQDRHIGSSMRAFARQWPSLKVDFGTRNIGKVWSTLVRRISQLGGQAMEQLRSKQGGNENSQSATTTSVKLYRFNLIVELINLSLFVVFKLLIIVSVITYLRFALKTQSYSLAQYIFLAVDRLGTMALGCQCMNNFAIAAYNVRLFALVYGRQYEEVRRKVGHLLRHLKLYNLKVVQTYRMALGKIIEEHVTITRRLSYLNRQVVSREFFIFLIMNLPFNIYLVTRIILGIPPQAIVIMINLIQLFCGGAAALAAITLNRKTYNGAAVYVPLQQSIPVFSSRNEEEEGAVDVIKSSSSSTKCIADKFRVMVLYEELTLESGRAMALGVTAGPLGLITAYSTFKFGISYFVYAIFSCTIIQNAYQVY